MKHDHWLCTRSGIQFDPVSPTAEMIDVQDIAFGLAGKFRFGAQSPARYTVAQHSRAVAAAVADDPAATLDDQLWGLLHDAAEAYLWDVQRPVKAAQYWEIDDPERPGKKKQVPFREIEMRIQAAVRSAFRLGPIMPMIFHEDEQQLLRERRDLFDERQPAWPRCDGRQSALAPIEKPCWGPDQACQEFLDEFCRIEHDRRREEGTN